MLRLLFKSLFSHQLICLLSLLQQLALGKALHVVLLLLELFESLVNFVAALVCAPSLTICSDTDIFYVIVKADAHRHFALIFLCVRFTLGIIWDEL